MVFGGVYGPPFVREGHVRREATMEDFRKFTMLAQSFPELDTAGGVICEPNDAPLDSRHLDMIFALQTLTDKFYMGNVVSGINAVDTIKMTEILFGGRDTIERRRRRSRSSIATLRCAGTTACSTRSSSTTCANQPVVLTPFLLMGAMSPVTIPSALVQQLAEALSGIALAQLIRPGCPVIFGSFLSNIDMQSGSPCFGTPSPPSACSAPVSSRGTSACPSAPAGGLNSSQMPDAQAAYEVAHDHDADLPRRHQHGHARRRVVGGRTGELL
jgi:trimethylamine--corrinoid protein Co-methyltransferase